MFKKGIIAVAFAATLMWGLIVPLQVFADNDYKVDCALAQLREVTSMLIAQDVRDFSSLQIVSSNIDQGFFTNEGFCEIEIKRNRIEELCFIFMKAQSIVSAARGLENESPLVIVLWSRPNYIGDKFIIGISYERYLEFTDIISDFTGIPKENIFFWVLGGIPRLDPTIGAPVQVDWCPDEAIQEASMRSVPTDINTFDNDFDWQSKHMQLYKFQPRLSLSRQQTGLFFFLNYTKSGSRSAKFISVVTFLYIYFSFIFTMPNDADLKQDHFVLQEFVLSFGKAILSFQAYIIYH